MDISKNGETGILEFRLTENELTLPHWRDFIEEIKVTIPSCDRDYDPKDKLWFIRGIEYWGEFYDLKAKYFEDPNQVDMFG